MSTSLLRVVERARREPEGRFHSLAHLIEVPALERAFHRVRADAAVGVDGVSKEDYGQELEANLVELHKRLKAKRYRHQPDGAVRTEAASGEDSAHCVQEPRGGTAQWEGAGHVRFSRVHDVLATDAARTLADVVQDAEQGPEAIQSNGLRMVSAPPTPTGRGPARSAQETLGRTLQLLRSERQPSQYGSRGSRHGTGLA